MSGDLGGKRKHHFFVCSDAANPTIRNHIVEGFSHFQIPVWRSRKTWGLEQDKVYVPPLPLNLKELLTRLGNALNLVTPDILKRVWEEIDYRLDVVRMTR
ncbi:hypothetical protein AVEN_220882-1 [Araneus ventricosus]|uniref:Uncharacterized protein n=1 Tax=Araneus ventricosus TaxID=182803 RepID=A0A4Y2HXC2_ARAVE|nr:hypothetical protein AVEN_220882-1 [Araneus ventricosus]